MNAAIAQLLGNQGLSGVQTPPIVAPQGNPIVVERDLGGPSGRDVDPYENFLLNNSDAILERDAAVQDGRDASEHKGMFGIKGTLRDVLGVVGDAFLLQSGNSPIYTPHRREEQLGDAMAGYSVDPIAAGERAMAIDPEFGASVINSGNQARRDADKLASDIAAAEALAAKRRQEIIGDFSSRAGNILYGREPEEIPNLVKQIERRLPQGISLEDIGLRHDMTAEEANRFGLGNVDIPDRERLKDADERTDLSRERNAESRRANRSREGTARQRVGIAARNAATSERRATVSERRATVSERKEARQAQEARTITTASGRKLVITRED